jgi:hypothetical protein
LEWLTCVKQQFLSLTRQQAAARSQLAFFGLAKKVQWRDFIGPQDWA